jgi:hypothetical protein
MNQITTKSQKNYKKKSKLKVKMKKRKKMKQQQVQKITTAVLLVHSTITQLLAKI